MELASLIEDLGKACGLELTLDEGRCTLRFDGEHDVTIERDGNAVILHGIAGDGGCLSNPDNLRILLTASFLGAEADLLAKVIPQSLISGISGKWLSLLAVAAYSLGTHRGNRALEAV